MNQFNSLHGLMLCFVAALLHRITLALQLLDLGSEVAFHLLITLASPRSLRLLVTDDLSMHLGCLRVFLRFLGPSLPVGFQSLECGVFKVEVFGVLCHPLLHILREFPDFGVDWCRLVA